MGDLIQGRPVVAGVAEGRCLVSDEPLSFWGGYDHRTGEITDRRAVRRAVEGVDRVFHVAGVTSMRRGQAGRLFRVNVDGTRNVMAAGLSAGVEKIVYTSTVGVWPVACRTASGNLAG